MATVVALDANNASEPLMEQLAHPTGYIRAQPDAGSETNYWLHSDFRP